MRAKRRSPNPHRIHNATDGCLVPTLILITAFPGQSTERNKEQEGGERQDSQPSLTHYENTAKKKKKTKEKMAKLRTCFLICKMRAFDRMITEILPPQKFHNIMVINTLRMGGQ